MAAGQDIGKLLGGLAGAIKGAQKDAIANRLMTDESIGEQPGAGVTQSLGKLGEDGTGGGGDGTTTQDLGPVDSTFTNPATGNVEPLQGSDDDLRSAIAASQLSGSGPTVGAAGGPQPAATSPNFSLRPEDLTASGPANANTVGSLIHTGGTQELDLQKEVLAMRLAKSKAAADAAGAPLETATRRAQLANIQSEIEARKNKGKEVDLEKNPPPATSINSEPVINQTQLNKHFEKTYGNGVVGSVISSINEPDKIDDPKNRGTQITNPNASAVSGDTFQYGSGNSRKSMPLGDAVIMVKQLNALRLKQGLPALRVPGEQDQTIGASAGNPYIAKNNLDVYSQPPGRWVRLPNGKVAQVPERRLP
jgi:hypothetical protein